MPIATASLTSELQQEYANPPKGNRLRASFGYGLRNGLGSRGKRLNPALKEALLPRFTSPTFAHAKVGDLRTWTTLNAWRSARVRHEFLCYRHGV